MLLSLRASLQADLFYCCHEGKTEVQDLGDSLDHVEDKMGEYVTSFNTLVDAHEAQKEDLTWIKNKLADLEDRSRCNNLTIRGIPEMVSVSQLPHYVQDLFHH